MDTFNPSEEVPERYPRITLEVSKMHPRSTREAPQIYPEVPQRHLRGTPEVAQRRPPVNLNTIFLSLHLPFFTVVMKRKMWKRN